MRVGDGAGALIMPGLLSAPLLPGTGACMHGWVHAWVDGCMDGCMNAWVHGKGMHG